MKIKSYEQTTCKFTGHKQKWTQGEWLFINTEECCLGLTVYKLALVNVPFDAKILLSKLLSLTMSQIKMVASTAKCFYHLH